MTTVTAKTVCPLDNCKVELAPTELLHHVLMSHNKKKPLQQRVISSGMRTMLHLPYRQLIPYTDQCLAVLHYAGEFTDDRKRLLPGVCGLCQEQEHLSSCPQQFRQHLPVLVMACKTTWQSLMYNNPVLEGNVQSENLYLFWLLSPATTRPVVATMGILNTRLEYAAHLKRLVRDFATRMTINQFLLGNDEHYIMLRESELDATSGSTDIPAFLEVVIQGTQK